MGVSLYPVLERDLPGVGVTDVVGKALARAVHESNLPAVWHLQDFFSVGPDDIAGLLPEGLTPPTLPAEEWFDAAIGLAAMRAALEAVRQEAGTPATEKTQAAVITDLERVERILLLAQEQNVRFHLAMDI